eukprot:TRINITY_DN13286_c0_g2_i1.p1 TRINITY_DN13286_c0_g2~~TRINITY_DN13286_c0_g2_i1.p1  ORF type:complete len:864 (-),score=226.37 TRINITY_DN13286_c0_g2_i1:194-2785(-)
MSSEWQKLSGLPYRKPEIYAANWANWDDQPDRLQYSVVAGAPCGGPIATVRDENQLQPVRGTLKTELQTWTSAGTLIAGIQWARTGLLAMGWTSQETLMCVFETGVVRTFTVMLEQLNVFTVDERIKAEGGAIMAALWPNGVALLTRKLNLYVNASTTRSGECCHKCADMKLTSNPLTLCVLPPPHEDSADVQVVVGTAEGPILLVDRHEARDLGIDKGPYMSFAVSSSGRSLACLSTTGELKILGVENDLQEQAKASVDSKKKPRQMVWCGDDCIALYLLFPTPSNTVQHVLFVGGPNNEWIPYKYDAPLHLVSECDGCRIVGTHKIEFVQRVPASTEAVFSIGNTDPPAMLPYALERFDKGDVCAQESLRLINKDDLADAVATNIDAAQFEYECDKVENLLNAAVFGRHFLSEPMDPKYFVETCRNLRICIELRKAPVEIPITVPQLEKAGFAGIAMRLAQRRQHLLAARICEWVGEPKNRVLFHWACEKIRHSRGSACTDEQLCEAILAKFKGCPGVGYAEVARVAAEMYRPHLATMLLNHEPRASAQVQVLLQLAREGDDENQAMMLRLAVEKAAKSLDPDLLHSAITAVCGGDACGRSCDPEAVAKLVKERPQELQVFGDLFAAAIVRGEQFDKARMYYETVGKSRLAAQSAVQQAFKKRDADERSRFLRFAKDFYGHVDSNCSEAEKTSMALCAQVSMEEVELLRAQVNLEEMSVTKRWHNAPHRFAGTSLVSTLTKLIEIGETLEADNLRTQMKVNDKRYWRIKVRALADSGNLNELNVMATRLTSPIGYELVIEAFLKHGRHDYAKPFVPKVKDPERQAAYYSKMGMEEEAQAALRQRQERGGAGRILQNILRFG